MLWNCFSSKGPGSVVHIHGIMDSRKDQMILNLNLAASAKKVKLVDLTVGQQSKAHIKVHSTMAK